MAFTEQADLTKVGIEDLKITLFEPGSSNLDDTRLARIDFTFLMSDDSIKVAKPIVNLLERLTDDAEGLVHLANLVSLRDYILARLNSEALP